MVTSCHNCVDGLSDLIKHYKLDMPVTQLVNLVANALVVEKKVVVPVEEVPAPAVAAGFEGYRILVIDDEPDFVTFVSAVGKSGDEVFEELRNDPELKSIPVCVITGQPELRKLIYDRPVPPPEGYLNKPVDEETLLLNIRKILKLPHGAKAIDAKSTQAQTEAPRG